MFVLRVTVLLAGCLFAVGCGGTADVEEAAVYTGPPDDLAIVDMAGAVEESAALRESLDELCGRAFGTVEIRPDLTVGLVADVASIDDGTFNQAAFEGMEAAGRCFGVATTFLESAGDDAATQIASLVEREVDIVVTVGFQFQEATLAAAANRADIQFVGVDQQNPDELANYVAISFRDDQVGFLAGAIAALMTESGVVAVVAGPDSVPPVVAIADGFEIGATRILPDVVVLRQHLESFVDGPAGVAQATVFVDDGADVVFGAAGETGAQALLTAAARGAKVIGVDQDEYYTTFGGGVDPYSSQLLSSAIKRVDLGVFLSVAAMVSEDLQQGGTLLLDAANGGVTYADFHQADVPPEVAAELEQLRIDLASGQISLPLGD